MKNKKRLKICRAQRAGLARTLISCQRENQNMQDKIRALETKIKALEVESFNLFCRNFALEQKQIKVGDDIEIEFEPLPVREWWKPWLP